MNEVEKQLLLTDLCSRLPYGVKGKVETTDGNGEKIKDEGVLNSIFIDELGTIYICIGGMEYEIEDVKTYLRPINSMTVGEVKELVKIHLSKYSPNSEYNNLIYIDRVYKHTDNAWSAWIHYRTEYGDVKQTCVIVGWVNWETTLEEINWLYKNHFDVPHWIKSKNTYKTMVELDLALIAPKEMYNN